MYKCDWYVSGDQIDPFGKPFLWKVRFCLILDADAPDLSLLTTMFSVLVDKAHNETEAIRLAFSILDESNIVNDN